MIHVHVLFAHAGDERPFGCSYIRLLQPLTYLQERGHLKVSWSTSPTPADVIIVERTWGPHTTLAQVEALINQVHREDTRLIFTLDDNLLDLETISTEQKMYMRYLARHAHGVIVSTEPLRERMVRLNPRVVTVPNQLDERLFLPREQPQPSDAPLTIGYMGTPTHDSDFMMVFQALRAVLRRHAGKVRLQLVGALGNPAMRRLLAELPAEILRVPIEDVAYPNFVAWMRHHLHWDLAIAPLEDNFFNNFKSDLKFLDYSALGFPGLYSNMPVYASTVRHQETGYLVENTPDAWETALEDLLVHATVRMEIAKRAELYVRNERTLNQHASEWLDAIARFL